MSQSMLESKLEAIFCRSLDESEIRHIKGNPQGLKGFPDRIVFADKIYWVELKVGKEEGSYYKQTKMQKKWQEWIEGSGGEYVLLEGRQEVDEWTNRICVLWQKKLGY